MARILTGIQSSGKPHLGNLLGAIQPAIALSASAANDGLYFIADLHSLTSIRNADERRNNSHAVAAAWLACGFDTTKNTLFRQSDLPLVAELMWYLSCFTPFPMLANAHSYKDKSERLAEVTAGLFTYPVLMAADILLYDVEIVPVGRDQKQHVEMARDMAKAVNSHYQTSVFVVPEAKIDAEVMTIPGTDGQKMSKSYGNTIDVFADEKSLKKAVMGIVSDSTPMDAPKDPEQDVTFKIFALLASASETDTMRKAYLAGGFGYGSAKKALLELILDKYATQRTVFEALMYDTTEIETELTKGAAKARPIAEATLARVRQVMGF